jgi:primosomal protein N'
MPEYCEVALPVPLDRTFTYALSEGQTARRGMRVIAPFRNEKLIGVVTASEASAPADVEVRALEAVLDEEPLLSEQLMALAEWMAQYYLAPLGEVLRCMLPLMAEVRRTVYYRITDLGRDVLAKKVEAQESTGQGTEESGEQIRERLNGDGGFDCAGFTEISEAGPKRRTKRARKNSEEVADSELRVLMRLS